MSARECVYIVQESAYGVPATSVTLGTNAMYIRLDGGNAYKGRMKPKRWEIRTGGGSSTLALTGADEYETKGNLKTQLYPAQAAMLLGWCGIPVNTAQTAPWVTTEPPGDLASCSVYHLATGNDGSIHRRWYPGMKVGKWGLDVSRKDPVVKLNLDLVGIKAEGNAIDGSTDPTATIFPAPTDAMYPTGPYVFSQSGGGVILGNGGAARTLYESLSIDIENALDPRCYASQFPQVTRYLGRKKSMLKAKLAYMATPNDRATMEGVTPNTCAVTFTSGAHSFALNFYGSNVWDDIDDDFDLDNQFLYTLSMLNLRDATAGNDVGIAVS